MTGLETSIVDAAIEQYEASAMKCACSGVGFQIDGCGCGKLQAANRHLNAVIDTLVYFAYGKAPR